MNNCGIDLASKSSSICIIDPKGKVLREVEVPTETGDFAKALSGFGPLQVILEASPLAEMAARIVEELGHEPVIIDARLAKNLMKAKKKTDRRDARTLADIGRSGWFSPVHRKSAEARELRSLSKARQTLVKTRQGTVNTIRGLLRAQGIRLGKVGNGEFEKVVQEVVRREVPGLEGAMENLLTLWKTAKEAEKQLTKEIEARSKADDVTQRMQSVPGVGPMISVLYRATIDDPGRFQRGEEVADYLGLAPSISQSGETEYRGRITKEGDNQLRWHLVEGAHVLLTKGKDCALKRWGLALETRKGSAKAKVAVARKLAILLWRLWKQGESFQAFPKAA
ncbi:IS110 family transposase [Microbulbifer sp.]|uniref:IS110 family transposase n=1 Tax=Microbulbifer sp. TaxID=1908541 RepID=UPI003F33CB08